MTCRSCGVSFGPGAGNPMRRLCSVCLAEAIREEARTRRRPPKDAA